MEPKISFSEAENYVSGKRNFWINLPEIISSGHADCMVDSFLDFLFPRASLTGGEGEFVTAAELLLLRSKPVTVETEQLRREGMLFIDRITAAADYDAVPLLRRAVHAFKYKKVRGMGEVLGQLLSETVPSFDDDRHPILCPVPLHWVRKFSRGFNQAEVLAAIVAKKHGCEMQQLLTRSRWTGSQVGRRRRERLRAVQRAFSMTSNTVPENVILVDDLSTTGSTLDACAEVLKRAGVPRVEGLVLAMG